MKRSSKERTRVWITGNDDYRRQWNDWARTQGVIAEDMLRKVLDKVMAHGKVSFDVECGYESSQSDNQTQ